MGHHCERPARGVFRPRPASLLRFQIHHKPLNYIDLRCGYERNGRFVIAAEALAVNNDHVVWGIGQPDGRLEQPERAGEHR